MGVTKMKKVTIISERSYQEKLLQTIQGMQNIEIRDLSQSVENNSWVDTYFTNIFDRLPETDTVSLTSMRKRIDDAVQFVRNHGKKKEKLKEINRRYISLQEIEENFNQEKLEKELAEIELLHHSWAELSNTKEALLQEEGWLTRWQYLDVNPNRFESNMANLRIVTLSSSSTEQFTSKLSDLSCVHFEEIYSDDKETSYGLVWENGLEEEIQIIFSACSVQIERYPYTDEPKHVLKQVKEKLREADKQTKQLSKAIGKKKTVIFALQWAEEVLLALEEREKIKNQFIQSDFLLVLQGWISADEVLEFQKELILCFGEEEVYLSFEDPTDFEVNNEVPTKLKNSLIVEPFELLTEMYALPQYEEIDPTPWMMPFYFAFFGMMVADIGYGLLMLIATTIVQKIFVFPRGTVRFIKFFQILSVPSIIWGCIYGSFFGMATPFPALLSTSEDVIEILLLSVVFGLIQILIGLFITAKEHLKRREYLQAIGDGFAWQGILIGLGLLAVGSMLVKKPVLTNIGAVLAIVSALSIVSVPVIQSSSKLTGLAKGAYDLYGVTGYIGDLVSYTRLMALGISGGSIAAAFNMLVGYMPPIARFTIGILLLLVLQGLNIFLTLLSAYVHGARLQYVEFFGKFYSGGGRKFSPLKSAEKYFTIERKKYKK